MSTEATQKALTVLLTDRHGVILDVEYNALPTTVTVRSGQSLLPLLAPSDHKVVVAMLRTLREADTFQVTAVTLAPDTEERLARWLLAAPQRNGFIWLVGEDRAEVRAAYDTAVQHSQRADDLLPALRVHLLSERTGQLMSPEYQDLHKLNNELLNMQRKLMAQKAQLQRLNEEKDHFLGMAAHDLRNPLGIVMHYSEYLLKRNQEPLTDTQADFLATIHSQAQLMLAIVTDFLNVSAIISGQVNLDKEPVDMAAFIDQHVRHNKVLFADKPIHLRVDLPEAGLPVVEVDRSKVEQVLNNLVTNAAKFSLPGSEVIVRGRVDDEAVVVSVIDEGPGIAPEEQKRLFQMFARTSNETTAGESSTGLGLAISRRLIEEHDGRIWLESEVGEGSTFSFALPLSGPTPPVSVEAESPPVAETEGRTLHVLVAEDNVINQKIVTHQLQKIGHEVMVVGDGEAAVTAVAEHSLDVVLMDINLPIMDGVAATEQIRQRVAVAHQPYIVALTGATSPTEKERCLQAGMNDFVVKPVKASALEAVLYPAAAWRSEQMADA